MSITADDTEVVEYRSVGLEPVDMNLVERNVEWAKRLILREDEETIGEMLMAINLSMNNDERIAFATIMKEGGPGETTRKSWISIYNEWLRIWRANERIK